MARRSKVRSQDGRVYRSPIYDQATVNCFNHILPVAEDVYERYGEILREMMALKKAYKEKVYSGGDGHVQYGNLLLALSGEVRDVHVVRQHWTKTKLKWQQVTGSIPSTATKDGKGRIKSIWLSSGTKGEFRMSARYLTANKKMWAFRDYILEVDYKVRCLNSLMSQSKQAMEVIRVALEPMMMYQGVDSLEDLFAYTGQKKYKFDLDDNGEGTKKVIEIPVVAKPLKGGTMESGPRTTQELEDERKRREEDGDYEFESEGEVELELGEMGGDSNN